jgi:hypothetical protein
MTTYNPGAYSPSGELWWNLKIRPGAKKAPFGAEPRLASWLMFNAKVGQIFTMRQLREELGESNKPNADEQLNRRLRSLRAYGWIILSGRDASNLKPDQYLVEKIGSPIWLGKSKFGKKGVTAKVRREMLDRDGHRCVLCGIGAGEAYPDQPSKKARLTIGHFVADSLHGPNDLINLRTECSRCNEPSKEQAERSESASELWPKMRDLSRPEKSRLLAWIVKGQRERDSIDYLFDQYRVLPAPQRDELKAKLERAVNATRQTPQ